MRELTHTIVHSQSRIAICLQTIARDRKHLRLRSRDEDLV